MNLAEIRNLDINNAGSWPPVIKALAIGLAAVLVAIGGYRFNIRGLLEKLDSARATEQQLRQEFAAKQRIMVNIDDYRAQLKELQTMLDTMLRQLPTRTEMPDLLEDISNTGRSHGLRFESFRPQDEQPRELYAAKPIAIRARANYHQLGTFTGSIAALPRIVTVENVSISIPQQSDRDIRQGQGPLLIEATLQTYRYLLEDEDIIAQ